MQLIEFVGHQIVNYKKRFRPLFLLLYEVQCHEICQVLTGVILTAREYGKSILVGCVIQNRLTLLLTHAHVDGPILIAFSKETIKASLHDQVSSGRLLVTLQNDEVSFC